MILVRREGEQMSRKKKKQEEIIKNEIGYSKLCFLSSDGVELIGNWSKYKDCYFSNLYFY